MTTPAHTSNDVDVLRRELTERDALIAALRSTIASFEQQIAALQSTLVNYANDVELYKRKLFGTKSERGGTSELQLTLGALLDQQVVLQKQLEALVAQQNDGSPAQPATATDPDSVKPKVSPKGRRDLSASTLPRVVVDITDAKLAQLGKLIGYEESYQLMYVRGGFKVLEKRTAKYEVPSASGPTVLGVETPKTLFPRTMLHSSLLAFIAVQKFALGVPHYRLEQHMEGQGLKLDRSTMCRALEDLGNTLGATVVQAMFRDAIANASVLSTDATGAAIQPGPRNNGPKQACKKGHFFTIVADCDHVLFAYTEKHTQEAVAKLFHGFRGFLQSDASSVYDILERGPPGADINELVLVGCWAHCRRYFFDAAICKYALGVEGLTRIRAMYHEDDKLKKLPPVQRKAMRQQFVSPLIDSFYEWARDAVRLAPARTHAARALGYALNQEQELRRVLLDGRLPMDNTRSERALRKIVVGRKNWMFYGSDTHAEAAAAVFTIIASCRLHKIDPEAYLDEVVRVLPYWPRERFIELAPKNWAATRSSLDADQLAAPVGVISVPG